MGYFYDGGEAGCGVGFVTGECSQDCDRPAGCRYFVYEARDIR